jgi:hypothetical protein
MVAPEQPDRAARSRPARRLRLILVAALRPVVLRRRQVDLPRWTRGNDFAFLHSEAVTWLDSHLAVIERGAPWLQPAGREVRDFCAGKVISRLVRFGPGFGASAHCVRVVRAVYGFDGPLLTRLRSLDLAIPPAGWELRGPGRPSWTDLDDAAMTTAAAGRRTRWMADRYARLRWRPAAAIGYPPGGPGTPPWGQPPLDPSMLVTWCSRGQDSGARSDPNRTRAATRNYLPVEVSATTAPDLQAAALERHEHELTVTLELGYYRNPNARARPHRMPRYLIPTRPGR